MDGLKRRLYPNYALFTIESTLLFAFTVEDMNCSDFGIELPFALAANHIWQ